MPLQRVIRTSKPRLRLLVHQLHNERNRRLILHVLWKLQRFLQYLLVNLVWILSLLAKRHIASHKLIQYDAEGP